MALFKILKGPESGLPEAKHEGWAYVTNEGNFYVDISDSVRVKINENADYAEQATYDSSNQKITDTYVKDVILNNHTSAPYYTLRLGNGALKDVDGNGADQVLLPVASATAAGVITTGTQTLTGAKTIDANGSLTVVKAGGFQYSGIQEGTSAGARPIWYSHASQVGTPCIGAELLYDPASTEAWTNYDTTSTAEAHGLLSVPRLKGIAFQALQDDRGQIIKNTYIKEITLPKDESIIAGSLSNPYLRYVLGDGATITKIALPAADGKNGGGIVTGAAQSISGVKTFIAQITADKGLYSKENIITDKQFESKIATGTAPFKVASTTVVENLNADTVDGMHASNAGFTFENSSTTIVPTQRAIWTSFNSLLQGAHALVYRGLIDPTNNSTVPTKPTVGDVYIISAEGTFNSVYCEPGDMAIYYAGGWDIVQVNIDGAVRIKGGGAAATAHTTENAIARFDNTTGRVIKNSAITITDAGHMLPQKVNASDATTKHNIGSSDNTWGTIYGTNFTGLSNQATHDSQGQVIQTNINSADFIGKRLSKLFTELKSRLHKIISEYSDATNENLSNNSRSLDDIKFTHSIGDTFFNYIFKKYLTEDNESNAVDISQVKLVPEDFYFGVMIFNKGAEFPMDFAPGQDVTDCDVNPKAKFVNDKSILFRHIMPPIFTELDTILDNWSKGFNDVTHSYNADWMKNKTLLSDVLCTPVGLAYCRFIKQAPKEFWTKKINFDNLVDVLKNILAVNIFYKLVLPLIDSKAVNRYLIYEILSSKKVKLKATTSPFFLPSRRQTVASPPQLATYLP